jgi:pimeloyl-ACP methyl ester carboxylesterase
LAPFRPYLSEIDARALTGELAAFVLDEARAGLRPGVEGWVEDDLAFLASWGFDVRRIEVDVLVWQGEQDLMVPPSHGRWLHEHVANARGGIVPGEGHLTLFVNRIGDVHSWLQQRLK